jgi:pimeloyl-ACP methyl ester carboxylesterase
LVLEASPTTLRGHVGLTRFVESVVSGLQDPLDPSFARSFVADTATEQLPSSFVDTLAGELMKVPARVWKEMFAGLLAYDDLAEIERINAPTLLLWGDADHLVDRAMQTTLASRICGAELLVYDGIGHTPRWEDPTRFALDVATFATRSLKRPP